MRISLVSNSPWSRTGYGNQTGLFAPRIRDLGHPVAITAFYGLEGGALDWNGIPVLPKGYDGYGNDIIAQHARRFFGGDPKAGLVLTLMDIWVLQPAALAPVNWCVPGDTRVTLEDGSTVDIKTLCDLKAPVRVLGYHGGRLVPANIRAFHKIPMAASGELLSLRTADRELRITADNEVAVERGGVMVWLAAEQIRPGDMVYSLCYRPLAQGVKPHAAQPSEAVHEHHPSAHRLVGSATYANRVGVPGRHHRRRRNHHDHPRDEEVAREHPCRLDADGAGSQHEREPAAVAIRQAGYGGVQSGSSAVHDAAQPANQVNTQDVLFDEHRWIPLFPAAPSNRTVLDYQTRAGGYGDPLHRTASRVGGLQRRIQRRTAGALVEGAGLERQQIVAVERLGRPLEYVYDLTTTTDNFIADDFLIHNCAWLPIDHDPIPPLVIKTLSEGGGLPIAYSRFGERLLKERFPETLFVPHGVDCGTFRLMDRETARRQVGMDPDWFVVGMVAANKGNPSRKCFPEAFRAFGQFLRTRTQADPRCILYVHTEMNGYYGGVNLPQLAADCGIPPTNVAFAEQYEYLMGYPDDAMAAMYNCFDVLLSPSMGEGFGIPILEAQACGVPVLVTDFSAMSELCAVGWKVGGQPFYTAQRSFQLLPNVAEIAEALEQAYRTRGDLSARQHAAEWAQQYHADRVTEEYWAPALDRAEQWVRVRDRVPAYNDQFKAALAAANTPPEPAEQNDVTNFFLDAEQHEATSAAGD